MGNRVGHSVPDPNEWHSSPRRRDDSLLPRLTLLALAFGLFGCGVWSQVPEVPDDELYVPPIFGARDSTFSDAQLLAAVYSTYRLPPGFYEEPRPELAPYYVNTISVTPSEQRSGMEWRELATEDTAQARAWAESTLANSTRQGSLLAAAPIVTERYIEYREDASTTRYPIALRSHRSSYLLPVAFRAASFYPDSLIGTFQVRPVDSLSVRGLAEYLHDRWYAHSGGARVLSSYVGRQGVVCTHIVYGIETIYGDYHMRDRLQLYRFEYEVDAVAGRVALHRQFIRSVAGVAR